MTVTVSSVPITTRKPGSYVHLNTRGAKTGLPLTPDKVILLGTQLSTATADPEGAVRVYSESEAQTLFGAGSPLALMVKATLEANPYLSELWACPLDEDVAAAAAAGTVTFALGTLTAGTVTFYMGRHVVRFGVAATDTANDIADALYEAIADLPWLPFAAASPAAAEVTLTANAKGTPGNDWVWAAEYTGEGLTITIVQPTGGATDPDIQDVLDAIEATQYDLIVSEWNDATSLGALKDHLDTVSGSMEQRPGAGVAGYVGAVADATTLGSGVNSGRVTVGYMRGTRTHPSEIAAAYAAAIAAESDRARPLGGVVLGPVVAPDDPTDRLTRTEQESCLWNGVACLEELQSGDCAIVRSVTTYVSNSAGAADDTLLDLQTIRVLDYVRYVLNYRFAEDLAQVKVADEAKTPNTTDPTAIKSLVLGVLAQLETETGYLENVATLKDRVVVERDDSVAGRVNCRIPADIVDGLHVIAGEIDLILG